MALKIINTPEFQRMRNIKQLGLCFHVYPAATHTRFEHSIGVYHLAGRMVEKIQQQYPSKTWLIPEFGSTPQKLNYKIAECIKIAALCHDIGHGPFSHIFDDVLLAGSSHPNHHHETRSCLIIEMISRRELQNELTENHIAFIKSIIDPQNCHRGALYQIVSNNLNGIDVDKFDYLARDSKNLGINTGFNANRLINEFIIDNNDNICYPKHCCPDIYELFHGRYMMHKKVYSHKTVKILELMMGDLFNKIDPIFNISSTIDSMTAFCKLTDETIFNYIQIAISPPPFIQINLSTENYRAITEANHIYQNILSRNLYVQILEVADEPTVNQLLESVITDIVVKYPVFHKDDFQIVRNEIGFVSGNKSDPFSSVYFYDKKENNESFTIKKSYFSELLNNKIKEVKWYLICKKRSYCHLISTMQKSLGMGK